jgi:REP element-mobilizing transposase RayT
MKNKPKHNPNIPHRRSIRLKEYDYAQAGLYFITICCQDRICRFGTVENGEMILNEYGQIANDEWVKLSERFPNFELDTFQIMPNHIHGIILLNHVPVGAGFTPAHNHAQPNHDIRATATVTPTQNHAQPQLDTFQIMPNHIHGIILLNHVPVWAGFTPAQNDLNTQNHAQPNHDIRATARVTPTQNDLNTQNDGQPQLETFQILPNHIHGIKLLNDIPVGAGFTPAQNDMQPNHDIRGTARIAPAQNDMQPNHDIRGTARIAPTVSDIVGAYKSLVANGCLDIYKSKNETMGKLWQRNYYEHIIRNEKSYLTISDYIINNPAKWAGDKFYRK